MDGHGLRKTSLPIDALYFNGGATTVRIFAERHLGPRDSQNNPLGGEVMTVFRAELTFPLHGALQGAVFTAVGSLRNDSIPGSGNLRFAIGVGLRSKLPSARSASTTARTPLPRRRGLRRVPLLVWVPVLGWGKAPARRRPARPR